MKEKLIIYKQKIIEYWSTRKKFQKTAIISGFIVSILAIFAIVYFTNKTDMAPLYRDLTYQETGQIKEVLDSRSIPYEISQNGTAILVPQEQVDALKIDLAGEGIPKSGSIDYSYFSERSGFGMTDNEFQMLKLDSTQTELENLIKSIDGVNDAKVMITMPQEGIFVRDSAQEASASIVLNTRSGQQFDQAQINALYHLVGKSIPNLSTDNIVIMNQFFEYYDLKNSTNQGNNFTSFSQLDLKREIERDIQRQVQQMLGMMMGHENVVVSVTTDIDFTQENREENLVTPVDPDNMEGIAVSVERITETYTGANDEAGGITGTQDSDIPSYVAGGASGSGDYERMEERINNDVNRIRREIVESPYKIRDMGIQVMVQPLDQQDLMAQQNTVNDIKQILSTIVRTSIDKDALGENPSAEEMEDRIVVSLQQFSGQVNFDREEASFIPLWVYISVGALIALVIILLFLLFRKRKDDEEEEEYVVEEDTIINIPDIGTEKETEATARRKQLEKLAKEKPDEFAKLLRSWLSE